MTTSHPPGGEPEHALIDTQRGDHDDNRLRAAAHQHLRNGKVEVFDCHIAFTTLYAQLGILPDYAAAVAASAPGGN